MGVTGHLPNVRKMYSAAPGNILIEGDYAQQELRVMHAVSGDAILGHNLASGDVYTEDAKAVFGLAASAKRCKCEGPCELPGVHVKAAARQACKIIHLTGQYGGGVKRVYEVALEEDRATKFSFIRQVYDAMWNPKTGTYRGTVAYWDRELARVAQLGYSESRILGRRLYYPRMPERSRVANYPIQSTAADMVTIAEVALDDALEADLILQKRILGQTVNVHDSIMLECKDDPAVIRDCMALLKSCMMQPFEIDGQPYVFPVDFKTGKVWSELKDYKEPK